MEERTLGGRYLLKDQVGSGGMATVYRAQDEVLDRTVAVKIMLPQYAGDATFAARFKQEAQAAAGLQSPYIVGVYDWGKDGDTYYIVMEYLRGTDLKSGVRSHGALDPKKVAQIGSQICGALAVAHKHEIVHRDIKPQNIMVQPDGNIKVMDFGIARAKNSHLTQDNNVLGTAHYVSPEQTRGQELGPTSDIYSLGVVMYECATGRVPFDGDDAISVALKQVNELPVPPSQIAPTVDADLERIILKCMEKDPANRFQSADELRGVLNSYLAGRAVDVPEPTRVIGASTGATETRVMNDGTQVMARPMAAGQTAANQAVRAGVNAGTPSFDDDSSRGGGDGMSKGKIAGIVVGIIAVVAIAIFAVSGLLGGGGDIPVPNVVGMQQKDAVKSLRDLGFKVDATEQEYSDQYDEGTVMDQNPDEGTKLKKDDTVKIVISRGPEPAKTAKVPDLTGKTQAEADAALAAVNLKGEATQEANDADEGTVFWQDISPDQEIEEGSTVKYKVSTGPDTTSVPDLTDMSERTATNTLDQAGFGVNKTYEYSSSVDKGTVISWNPSGQQAPGTTITLVISNGPDPDSELVDVPNLTGMTKAQAEQALQSAGFVADVSYADGAANGVAEDHVIRYSPSGKQKPGTTISVVVAFASEGDDSSAENADS